MANNSIVEKRKVGRPKGTKNKEGVLTGRPKGSTGSYKAENEKRNISIRIMVTLEELELIKELKKDRTYRDIFFKGL